jgi:hypothetical protein
LWRKIQDDEIWKNPEPFNKRDAWIDLLLMTWANDKNFIVGDKVLSLKSGQIFLSYRFICSKWHWSKGKLRRYFNLLADVQKVNVTCSKNGTLITILNWDTYQPIFDVDGTLSGHKRDTNGTNQRYIKIVKEEKPFVDSQNPESTEGLSSPSKKPKPKPDSRIKELFEFWEYKFSQLYDTPPILKFGRDGKLIKDLLGYSDNHKSVPLDCKTILIAMCIDDYLDEQDKREENYKNPTIPGLYKAFETLITQINWDDPNWERMRKEYAKERDEIEKRKTDSSGLNQTSPEHAPI